MLNLICLTVIILIIIVSCTDHLYPTVNLYSYYKDLINNILELFRTGSVVQLKPLTSSIGMKYFASQLFFMANISPDSQAS